MSAARHLATPLGLTLHPSPRSVGSPHRDQSCSGKLDAAGGTGGDGGDSGDGGDDGDDDDGGDGGDDDDGGDGDDDLHNIITIFIIIDVEMNDHDKGDD